MLKGGGGGAKSYQIILEQPLESNNNCLSFLPFVLVYRRQRKIPDIIYTTTNLTKVHKSDNWPDYTKFLKIFRKILKFFFKLKMAIGQSIFKILRSSFLQIPPFL